MTPWPVSRPTLDHSGGTPDPEHSDPVILHGFESLYTQMTAVLRRVSKYQRRQEGSDFRIQDSCWGCKFDTE